MNEPRDDSDNMSPRDEECIERFRALLRKARASEITRQQFIEEFMAIEVEFEDVLGPPMMTN